MRSLNNEPSPELQPMGVRMPFRVDDIRRTAPNRWEFDLLGLYGWPCFAVLRTDETGHGLTTDETYIENLILWEVVMPYSRRQILGQANFEIAEHAGRRSKYSRWRSQASVGVVDPRICVS